MKTEERIVYDITTNLWNTEFDFVLSNYGIVDYRLLLEISVVQRVFYHIYEKVKNQLPTKERLMYRAYWFSHEKSIEKAMLQSQEIENALGINEIRFGLIKGFVLAQLLYGNCMAREFADIDILVHTDDILHACEVIEKLGYTDDLFRRQESCGISLPIFEKNLFYFTEVEKRFFNYRGRFVDVQKSLFGYTVAQVKNATECGAEIMTVSGTFHGLTLQDSFLVLLENTYKNFFTEYGISEDFVLRDIIDFYSFLVTQQELFSNDFLTKLKNNIHFDHLKAVVSLVKACLPEIAIQKIPQNIIECGASSEFSNCWNIKLSRDTLLELLFSRQDRIEIYRRICLKNAIIYTDSARMFETYPVTNRIFSLSEGRVALPIVPWMNPQFMATVSTLPLFGVSYDAENLYVSIKIPYEYPNINILYTFLCAQNNKNDQVICEVYFDVHEKKVEEFRTDIPNCTVTSVTTGNDTVFTVYFPRHGILKHCIAEHSEYLLFFDINYGKELAGANNVCMHGTYLWIPRYIVEE